MCIGQSPDCVGSLVGAEGQAIANTVGAGRARVLVQARVLLTLLVQARVLLAFWCRQGQQGKGIAKVLVRARVLINTVGAGKGSRARVLLAFWCRQGQHGKGIASVLVQARVLLTLLVQARAAGQGYC